MPADHDQLFVAARSAPRAVGARRPRDLLVAASPVARSPSRTAGVATAPRRPESITICVGESAPAPSAPRSRSNPCTDGSVRRHAVGRAGGQAAARGRAPRRATGPPIRRRGRAAGRRMIERASLCQKPDAPRRRRMTRRRALPLASVDGEECRQQRRRGGHRDERDQEAADAERAHERDRDEEEEREPERDRRPGEDDGASCGRHRANDGVVDRVVALELLPKPVDDEQRVVDRQREADQLDEIRDVGRHHREVRDGEDESERRRDRRTCEQERQRDDR